MGDAIEDAWLEDTVAELRALGSGPDVYGNTGDVVLAEVCEVWLVEADRSCLVENHFEDVDISGLELLATVSEEPCALIPEVCDCVERVGVAEICEGCFWEDVKED